MNIQNFKNTIKNPFVIIMIGPPLSGKTTFIKKHFPDVKVISRDDILLSLHDTNNYEKAFKEVNQKEVDQILHQQLLDANKSKESVIIDMTHMTSKRRRKNLEYFSSDFYKVAIIFPILSDKEYIERNEKRFIDEEKNIPIRIINNMISSYQTIREDEGFDRVISL